MNKPSLEARRTALVERCAEQRVGLAYELNAVKQSVNPANVLAEHPLAGYIVNHKKLVLGLAVTALGLAVTRPTRLFGLLGSALTGWKTARNVLGLLASWRQ